MTDSIILKVHSINKFEFGEGTEYHVSVCVSDLLEANGKQESSLMWNIPLEANVRRPNRNSVVDSIVDSLQKGIPTISSPLHISADCVRLKEGLIKLTFRHRDQFSDGLLDGGHRLLSFCVAANNGADLTRTYVTIIVYSNFNGRTLKEKAVALNTSQAVSSMSLANYAGAFDWMKPSLEKYRIIYHEGQFGKYNNLTDVACTINRVCQLLLSLDTSYSPCSVDGKKRHPLYIVKSGTMVLKKETESRIKGLFPMVHDAIDIQSRIFCELAKRHEEKGVTLFTQAVKDTRRFTRLPNHESIPYAIKSGLIVFPILSAFRAYVEIQPESGLPVISATPNKKTRIIKAMVSRYCEVAKQTKYEGQNLSAIAKDSYTWDQMCAITYGKNGSEAESCA